MIVEDIVEFVWLTTWREEAVSLLNPMFDFPEHVNYLEWQQRMSDYNHSGKGHAVIDYFGSYPEQADRKIVWLDDVATRSYANWNEEDGFGLASSKAAEMLPSNRLILQTNDLYGISRAEMNTIENFVV